jgi:hypothetical protein
VVVQAVLFLLALAGNLMRASRRASVVWQSG